MCSPKIHQLEGLVTAIALSGGLLVSAHENPTQNTVAQKQDSEKLYAGGFKKIPSSVALADKNVKAALDGVYAQFPEAKSYENTSASFLDRGDSSRYVITLSDKDFKNHFTVAVNSKTGQVSYTVQSLKASEVLLYDNVKSGVDKMHALHPETKSYEITEASVTDDMENNFSVSYHITLSDKDSKDSIVFSIDGKTGELLGNW
ncbi:hypothetical protein JNUCC42_17870 [Brevibacterium sp. JNUCC-42]|nr:hypothetical protein JNUCC42_17870 [Brevibacterium sp. JNUCC-42]